MVNYTINEKWFNEIKDIVPHANPYVHTEEGWHENFVEVDILNEDLFISVSKKLGWM